MKTLIVIVSLMLTGITYAQDTIYSKNGNVINAKVVEIGQNEIKYKKASNPDGPMYSADKSDIVLIHYKNGSKDVFSSPDNNSNNSQSSAQQNQYNNSNRQSYYQRPRVNVVIAPPMINPMPFAYYGGWGRPYYGGYYHPHYYGGHHHGWH